MNLNRNYAEKRIVSLQVFNNISEILNKNKNKRNKNELVERNAILAACINADFSPSIFKDYFSVHDYKQRKKHIMSRHNYISGATNHLSPLLYEKKDYYPAEVKAIMRSSFEHPSISILDCMSKKILRNNKVYIRRWLYASNIRENHEIFVTHFKDQILEYSNRVPSAQLLEKFRPPHCVYFKCSQYGSCSVCILALKNFFVFSEHIKENYNVSLHKTAPSFIKSEGICHHSDNIFSCMNNDCSHCDIQKKFTVEFFRLNSNIELNPESTIKIYLYQQTKQNENSKYSQTELVYKKVKLSFCLKMLQKIMKNYKFHWFSLKFQNSEISKLIRVDYHLPYNTLLIFADFSENVGQKSASVDGYQSQYRTKLSFSLLNFVCFYSEDKYQDDDPTNDFLCRKNVRFDFHSISTDVQKDNLLFIKSFNILLKNLIKKKNHFFKPKKDTKIERVIFGSDTSNGEFKSVAALARLNILSDLLNLTILCITFTPQHGKWLYDLAGYHWEKKYNSLILQLEKNEKPLSSLEEIKKIMNLKFRPLKTSRIKKRHTFITPAIAPEKHCKSAWKSNQKKIFNCFTIINKFE